MATATEVTGPVVRMCGNPQCGSGDRLGGCRRIAPDCLMGMSMGISPEGRRDEDGLCAFFSRELSLTYATDSAKVRRVIPDGCEFTLHKAPAWFDFETKALGHVAYSAVYSGPARDRDEALAGSPEWDWDTVHARYKRMQAGGSRLSLAAGPAAGEPLCRLQQQPDQGKSSHARRLIGRARPS